MRLPILSQTLYLVLHYFIFPLIWAKENFEIHNGNDESFSCCYRRVDHSLSQGVNSAWIWCSNQIEYFHWVATSLSVTQINFNIWKQIFEDSTCETKNGFFYTLIVLNDIWFPSHEIWRERLSFTLINPHVRGMMKYIFETPPLLCQENEISFRREEIIFWV